MDPIYVPINESELNLEKKRDQDFWKTRSLIDGGEEAHFIEKDYGILFRSANGEYSIFIYLKLCYSVLQMSHYSKISLQYLRRKLYPFLKKSFYWATMQVDCYAVSRKFLSFPQNRVLFLRHKKPLNMYPVLL